MAFVFCDGFDRYTATADLIRKWSSNDDEAAVTFAAAAGKRGGGALKITDDDRGLWLTINQGSEKIRIAFWVKISAKPAGNDFLVKLVNGAKSGAGHVVVQTDGTLVLGDWYSNVTSYHSAAFGNKDIADNNWHHIELELYYAGSGGLIKAWVDGTLDANYAGDTQYIGTPDLAYLALFGMQSPVETIIDDIIVWNDTGSDFTGQKGALLIETLAPTADDAVQFARSGGATNVENIDDNPADEDATYVESGTGGDRDTYSFGNLTTSPSVIAGVVSTVRCANPGGGSIQMKHVAKSAASVGLSAAQDVPAGYGVLQELFTQDPATTAAWTTAAVDAAVFGFEVV